MKYTFWNMERSLPVTRNKSEQSKWQSGSEFSFRCVAEDFDQASRVVHMTRFAFTIGRGRTRRIHLHYRQHGCRRCRQVRKASCRLVIGGEAVRLSEVVLCVLVLFDYDWCSRRVADLKKTICRGKFVAKTSAITFF